MAKSKHIKRPATPPAPTSTRPTRTPEPPSGEREGDSGVLVGLRFTFLLVALGATAMLVGSHFHLFQPPGCGAGGGCDKAAQSEFGRVPGLNWPVSFLGFSYYFAMLVALIATKGRVTGVMRHLARLGGLVSAFYLFIIILHRSDYLCAYCITSHLANFGFLATVELAWTATGTLAGAAAALSLRSLAAAAIGFVAATAGLAGGEVYADKQSRQRADASADAVIERAKQQAAAANQTPAETKPAPAVAEKPAPTPPRPQPASSEAWETRAARLNLPVDIDEIVSPSGFTGRWRIGPEDAPIRIVAFSDYQCPDCRRVEEEIREILLTRTDVSFSHKHFPFNSECNPTYKSKRTPHPNACWAARAAEAAGILRGNRGFWEMHFWLYERKDASGKDAQGQFTDPELIAGLTQLGYDPVEFQRVMQSPEAGQHIGPECLEGQSLGLMFTPLIYINGIEFREWYTKGALKRAVERIAASNPPRGSPTQDQPANALLKAVEDWQISYVWPPDGLKRDGFSMASGPENAPISIIFWGDYEDENSQKMNKAIMERYRDRKDVKLDFRHYPFHEDCNMFAEREDHTRACRMASLAEGAGRLGGPEKFWAMHHWLMETGAAYDEEKMKTFARSIGLDPDELVRQAESPEVRQTIHTDCAALQQKLGARFVPAVVVNWRLCPRWTLNDGTVVLPNIFDAAEKELGLKN